jgi:cytidyltransferase-like protein
VIVASADLDRLAGQVTMVDGGFDPLHPGHVEYFRAAAELELPVLCNVSSDDWVVRKHAPLLTQEERAALIDAIRFVDYTHLSSGSTASVLRALRPRLYAKGADWEGRLPAEERRLCEELEIEIVFLDTVSRSSTDILLRYEQARAARA